jgi:Domain of unknown function (DUF4389)
MPIKASHPSIPSRAPPLVALGKADKMETIDSHIATAPAKSEVWKRGIITLAFVFAFGVAQSILYLTAVAQFLWLLFAKEPNKLLVEFGQSLAVWLAHTAKFLCCATDEKPFPWTAWPTADRS